MDPEKFNESVKKIELILGSLRNIMDGVARNEVKQTDIKNVEDGLSKIQDNVRSCL